MAGVGHFYNPLGESEFRVFAPGKRSVRVLLLADARYVTLQGDACGYWTACLPRLPEGTRYLIEIDGARVPDIASRCQPDGVHGPSMVAAPRAPRSPGWTGIAMTDAIVYELHLGTFTPEGTLVAACGRLPHLRDLGINMIELLPLAAFPGQRNWGYDGVQLFALHAGYGTYGDLQAFIEQAHALGMAVILDVVYNHFGPEGCYASAFAPYTRSAATPWGAAINFDGAWNHGVREFFLENLRYWLADAGFDGVRMDAVSLIFDTMPVHFLRECTDLARAIGAAQQRTIVTIAEHLRNNKYVTSDQGFRFDAQWSDDLNHAVFAQLTGERARHYVNFGAFADVVHALAHGFVLDGSRFDRHSLCFTGTDAGDTAGHEHVVHMQNHDQVGNRLHGDRMISTYGRDKALLAFTAMMASPFVPMLFMGEEYGEHAPFLFFEDFSDPLIIDGAREGRKADFGFAGAEPADPHHPDTFARSHLQWARAESAEGRAILDYYRQLIALKRSGELGPRARSQMRLSADHTSELIHLETRQTLAVLNFSQLRRAVDPGPEWTLILSSSPGLPAGQVGAHGALVFRKRVEQ